MQFLLTVGIGQGVILALLLIYKSVTRNNNAWLIGLFVFVISAYLSGPLLNRLFGEPEGSFLVDPLLLLIGPSFYLYVRSFLYPIRRGDLLLHIAPFLLYLPVLTWFYLEYVPVAPSQVSLQRVYSTTFAIMIAFSKFAHLTFYCILSYRALRQHEDRIKRIFADLTGRDLAWLKYMLGAFILLVAASLFMYVLALRSPDQQETITLVNLSCLSVFILTLSFYAFHQNNLFDYAKNEAQAAAAKSIATGRSTPKYEKSGLTDREAGEIRGRINAFLEAGGYLDPDLTLTTMAEAIRVPPYKISEVLSQHMNTSFYDLINERRVADIQQAMLDPERAHLTILAIAYDHGYNSKSTFNTAFKKIVGTTPSLFKRQGK